MPAFDCSFPEAWDPGGGRRERDKERREEGRGDLASRISCIASGIRTRDTGCCRRMNGLTSPSCLSRSAPALEMPCITQSGTRSPPDRGCEGERKTDSAASSSLDSTRLAPRREEGSQRGRGRESRAAKADASCTTSLSSSSSSEKDAGGISERATCVSFALFLSLDCRLR